MGPRDCYLCWCCFKVASYTPYPTCMTEEQVWLLICAVVSGTKGASFQMATVLLDCLLKGSNTVYSVRH